MIVPSTRVFTAGEVETGAYLNSAVTNLGNFMLGKPICEMYSTVATSIPANTITPIPFANEVIDRDNAHSTSTSTTVYQAQTAGWYFFSGVIHWAATAGTYRLSFFRIGSTTPVYGSYMQQAGTSQASVSTTSNMLYYMNVGDTIELVGLSGTATTLAAVGLTNTITASMSVIWVSS